MKVSAHAPVVTPRQVRLEKELEDSWGTYMYCEAADFQSSEERETSRRMSTRMGELHKELAQLRGGAVLCEPHVAQYVERLQAEQPLARVGGEVLAQTAPFLGTQRSSLTDDVAELQDALIYGTVTRADLDAAVVASAPALVSGEDAEVRAQAASLLRDGVPRTGPDLFASPAELVESVRQNPEAGGLNRAVAELVHDGTLSVSAADLAKGPWQCVYQEGDLGRWTDRFEQADSPSRARNLAKRMETMLEHPGLLIGDDERARARQALSSAG